MLIDKLQQENIFPVFGVAVLDTNGNINNNLVYQSYQVHTPMFRLLEAVNIVFKPCLNHTIVISQHYYVCVNSHV